MQDIYHRAEVDGLVGANLPELVTLRIGSVFIVSGMVTSWSQGCQGLRSLADWEEERRSQRGKFHAAEASCTLSCI